jgi:uncharacterized protein with HEPN domain
MAVISEAAVRLRDDAERLVPEIPWRDIRGIGNWLRHQDDRVNSKTVWVWNTIHDDLRPSKLPSSRIFVMFWFSTLNGSADQMHPQKF